MSCVITVLRLFFSALAIALSKIFCMVCSACSKVSIAVLLPFCFRNRRIAVLDISLGNGITFYFSFLISILKPSRICIIFLSFWICVIRFMYFLTVRWFMPVWQTTWCIVVFSCGIDSKSLKIRPYDETTINHPTFLLTPVEFNYHAEKTKPDYN